MRHIRAHNKEDFSKKVEEYLELRRQQDRLITRMDKIKAAIKEEYNERFMESPDDLKVEAGDGKCAVLEQTVRNTFQTTAFKKEHQSLYDQYADQKTFFSIKIKDEG